MTMPASGFFSEGDADASLVPMGTSNVTIPISNANTMVPVNDMSVVNNMHPNLHHPQNVTFENQNALQLALELTLMRLNNKNGQNLGDISNEMEAFLASEEKKKASSHNMTECVPVPSSEHVAEIVGRQGCKIKALRAKTNTYIKTPVRGEEPVFVVTGRNEDVSNAKIEIMSAAEHFSQIRACRKNNTNGSLAPGPPNVPGQITVEVKVPYRVVGLVVGPKGATIKRIQQQTQTYIVTPSREKEPVFEVTGLPDNVYSAEREIEAHIAMRTGSDGYAYDEQVAAAALALVSNGRSNNQQLGNFIENQNFLTNLCKLNDGSSTNSLNVGLPNSNGLNTNLQFGNSFGINTSIGDNGLNGLNLLSSDRSVGGFHSSNGYGSDMGTFSNSDNSLHSNGLGAMDVLSPIGSHIPLSQVKSAGLGISNGFYDGGHNDSFATNGASIWSDAGKTIGTPLGLAMNNDRNFSATVGNFGRAPFASANNSNRVSPEMHLPATRSSSDPDCLRNPLPAFSHTGMDPTPSPSTQSLSSSPELAAAEERMNCGEQQKCIVCKQSNAVAALIPCGHNLFCVDCANVMVAEKTECKSPVCDQIPTHSIRILRSNQA